MLQPDTQGHRSYRESFTRRRNLTPEVLTRENLLTDRGAYLNFLEVQLERVSAACLAAQDVSAKIEVVAGQTSAVDEKVLGATRLVRLAQTYSEEQGRDQARINEALEERLATLEQRARLADADAANAEAEAKAASQSSPLAAAAMPKDGGVVYGLRRVPTSCPSRAASPSPPITDEASLSRWIADVDKRLDDLRKDVAAIRSPGDEIGDALAPRPHVGAPVCGESVIPEEDEEEEEGVEGEADEEKHRGEHAQRREEKEEEKVKVDRASVAAEAAKSAAAAAAAAVAASAAAQLAEKGLANVEERVRHLEASFDHPMIGEARVNKKTSRSPRVAESGRGRSPRRGTKLDFCNRSRSPGRSGSRSRNRSPPLLPLAPPDASSDSRSTSKVVLDAVEEGNAVARRAGEVAQEALMLGKEAAERSERAESLARSLAVHPITPADDEKSGEITHRLDHTEAKETRRKSGRGVDSAGVGGTDTMPAVAAAPPVAESRRECRLRAVNAILGEAGRTRGSTGPTSGAGSAGGQEGRGRWRAPHTAEEIRAISSGVGEGSTSSGTLAAAEGGETDCRPVCEIRNILERLPTDSENERRIALRAVQTALKSITSEASAGQPDRRAEGEKSGRAPVGKSDDIRKVAELREAVWGAVGILSGISGSHLAEKQRRSSSVSRRGKRPGLRVSRSRDLASGVPREERVGRHVGGCWVPPGNIPSKVGQRRGGVGLTRAPWGSDGDGRVVEESRFG